MADFKGTIRGTTPSIIFTLPFNVSEIKNCEVYFGQNDELIITKAMEDCSLSENHLTVTLTQEDTLLLSDDSKLQIQLRFAFNDGSVDATTIFRCKVGEILKEGVIDVE